MPWRNRAGRSIPVRGSIFSPYREEPGPPLRDWDEIEATPASQARIEAPLSPAAVHIPEPAQTERASSVEVPFLADSVVSAVPPTAHVAAQLRAASPPPGRRSELAPEEQPDGANSEQAPQDRIALTTEVSASAPASPGADRPLIARSSSPSRKLAKATRSPGTCVRSGTSNESSRSRTTFTFTSAASK